MNISTALELLYYQGSLTMGDNKHPSPENDTLAYKTILLSKDPEVNNLYFIHQPSKNMLLMPTIGLKATLYYPNDFYPYEVVKVTSEKRINVREMTYENNPQTNINGIVLTLRLNQKGQWKLNDLTFTLGHAKYYNHLTSDKFNLQSTINLKETYEH